MPDGIWIAHVDRVFATEVASLRDFYEWEELHQTFKSRSDVRLVGKKGQALL
jgi:peptide methionine sulfoxide reductase MsrA